MAELNYTIAGVPVTMSGSGDSFTIRTKGQTPPTIEAPSEQRKEYQLAPEGVVESLILAALQKSENTVHFNRDAGYINVGSGGGYVGRDPIEMPVTKITIEEAAGILFALQRELTPERLAEAQQEKAARYKSDAEVRGTHTAREAGRPERKMARGGDE